MDIQPKAPTSMWQRAAPALLMMILAPTVTELLLGGARLSTLIPTCATRPTPTMRS
jgi:hypothetical protein